MATRLVTINEIINIFKSIADNHLQINDFGYGRTSDISTSRNMRFPYLWVTHQSDSYVRIENRNITPDLKFTLMVLDQINQQKNIDNDNGFNSDNSQEILSDTFQIIQDILSYINTNAIFRNAGIVLYSNDDVRITPVVDDTTDKSSGWSCELTLRLMYVNCDMPIIPIPEPSDLCPKDLTILIDYNEDDDTSEFDIIQNSSGTVTTITTTLTNLDVKVNGNSVTTPFTYTIGDNVIITYDAAITNGYIIMEGTY